MHSKTNSKTNGPFLLSCVDCCRASIKMSKKDDKDKEAPKEKPRLRALERTLVDMFETCVTTCKYIFKELNKQGYVRAIMCAITDRDQIVHCSCSDDRFAGKDLDVLEEKLGVKDFNYCLLMAAELIKCEPFMDKRQIYSSILEV